ncbi:MAG TPA: hypothetical protein VL134_13460 [Leptolyngbya sp.]|nr:hypothetical protein [Leptolyngbya sp.]
MPPDRYLPNVELPIAVHRPIQITRHEIALVEGVGAKPLITAQLPEVALGVLPP